MILQTNTINLQHFKPFENQKVWAISNADKIPIQSSGKPSRVNDPSNWVSLEDVLQYTNTHQNCLPAVILNDQLNLIFLDLDDVIDPRTQKTEVWAQEVIDACNSYTERSKSGKGIHIFLRGSPPRLPAHETLRCRPQKKFWDKEGEIEFYFTKKAAAITGDVIVDKPIRSIGEGELFTLYRKFFPENEQRTNEVYTQTPSPAMSDDEVIKLARASKNCEKFIRLFDHSEWDGSNDRSAMDLSLANSLAFYTQDPDQIKRLMMSSTLRRDKWDREDYLPRTIESAIKSLTSTYQPPIKRKRSDPIPIKTTTNTTGEPFPVECLPPVLCNMAKEMQAVTKTPLELCCAAILSAASIATKGTVKVFEKENLTHFTCFFFMIIAETGERKSNVLKAAFAPIYQHQDEDKERYFDAIKVFRARQKAAKHEEKKILGSGKSAEEKAQEIELIDKELESYKPRPYRYITDNFTDPALFKLLEENNGSFAVMTLDGGNVLDYIRGHGHGADGSLNDSLLLKATWGDSISRDRIGNTPEGEHLFIKDPACHVTIAVQPDRCRDFLSDPRLRGSGLIARILPIICSSTIGTRFETKDDLAHSTEVVEPYHKLIRNLFEQESITEVRLGEDTSIARREFFNEIEQEMAFGNSLEDLRDIGSKATTQVTRLAALFEVYQDPSHQRQIKITKATWYQAEAVGRWFLDQAAHLQRTDYDELVLFTAQKISERILDSNLATNPEKPTFTKRDFQQRFKRELQKSTERNFIEDVLSTLVSYQWIIEVPGTKLPRYKVNKKEGE